MGKFDEHNRGISASGGNGSRVADVFSAEAISTGLEELTAKDRAERVSDLNREMRAAKSSREAQGMFLASLARMCRSAGVMIIGATQYPMSSVIDPQFRANMGLRVMLRVPSDEMIPVCLGHGQHQDITSDSISEAERGGLWVAGLGSSRPVRGRGLYVQDDDVAARAAQTAHLRWAPEDVFVDQADPDSATPPAPGPATPPPTTPSTAAVADGGLPVVSVIGGDQ